tara:strand:+ start:1425 stop:2573 length:1149 start_codon:yes stop_codon:yes gene_type:complete
MALLNKKKNLIFCSSEYITSKEYGGLGIFLQKFFKELKKNYNIHLIVSSSDNKIYHKDGIFIYNVKTNYTFLKILKKFFLPIFFIFQSWIINKRLDKLIIKLDHAELVHFSNYQCIGLLYKNKLPTITRLSSLETLWNKYNFFSISAILEKYTLTKTNLILSPSNFLISELKKSYGLKSYFLPPLIEKLKKKKIKVPKKIVITFGSISPGKGSLIIENIINKLLNIDNNLFYYWIGNVDKKFYKNNKIYEKRLKLKTKFPKRLKVIKKLNRRALFNIINKSSLIILPSLRDNSPNACLEALAMEKIIIARKNSGYDDLIKNKFNGFLFSKNKNLEIIDLVYKVLSLRNREKKKLERNIRTFNKNFHSKKVINVYKKYIKKII